MTRGAGYLAQIWSQLIGLEEEEGQYCKGPEVGKVLRSFVWLSAPGKVRESGDRRFWQMSSGEKWWHNPVREE